jgi:hypothetical protein
MVLFLLLKPEIYLLVRQAAESPRLVLFFEEPCPFVLYSFLTSLFDFAKTAEIKMVAES